MSANQSKKGFISKFPGQFWLVVMFEFFERGSYYGMMSILSVYLTANLGIAKESVGLIKGVIQPLLYFLPIISGALADRFGYRKTLMVAFSLLGMGYFLTAQATEYAWVFGALVIMGFGAGTFKPIISGTIARVTDEKNSTLGFGIFYWSINLGAFLFPLVLVPFLKAMNPAYVILAAAIGTASMLIPTFFFFKDPIFFKAQDKKVDSNEEKEKQTNLIQTLANAFEIIYSPIILLYNAINTSVIKRFIYIALLGFILVYGLSNYLATPTAEEKYSKVGIEKESSTIVFNVTRNMSIPENYLVQVDENAANILNITIYKPGYLERFSNELIADVKKVNDSLQISVENVSDYIKFSDKKITIAVYEDEDLQEDFGVHKKNSNLFNITLKNIDSYNINKKDIYNVLKQSPELAGFSVKELDKLIEKAKSRSFFLLYVAIIILIALSVISFSKRKSKTSQSGKPSFTVPTMIMLFFGFVIWFLPGISILGKIISYVVFITVTSLFIIDKSSHEKFVDHAKFLLMIFLYSWFWILYFQMFDSVLWYVQAYVDATTLNNAVNSFLGLFGIHINWFFDVEHVTVINAGTIILLQLVISSIVKNTKALPTMIVGITVATIGMAILAISADIWVFMLGITLFSIGEMTTHPKFISYIGLIAPSDKKAMYMGYLFLYGVFGSSIGGILGAKLYVHFVDNLNQPKTLWLIFSGIGIATIVALLLYNKFLAPKHESK